ncbi:MAG: fibro-slime domain-containing protein [Epsilonproteobacteria bacterium]|nr:fibro-slime domain-containing protein [Campylobacterota bacterium]
MPYNLTLTKVGNVYQYSNTAFFPLDNKLIGNEGNPNHNYHFTYEIHSNFTYKGGEIFEFEGDDDVWVFINNKLAVDLGGIHVGIKKSVNLDTLGLTKGQTYNFDFFFAERYRVESKLKITTSIELKEDIPTCDVKADIWYANDESGSIDATEFSQSKTFLNEIAKRFRYSAVDGVQSSLIGWGGYEPKFDNWFNYYKKEKIDYKMRINLTSDYRNQLLSYNEQLGTDTKPHSVTDYVATLIRNKTGRADAGQVMVLLTDANSNQILESWVNAANRFRANTTNSKIVVVLIAEAATAYKNEPAKKSIVDRVIGSDGLVLVTDSYANIVDQ